MKDGSTVVKVPSDVPASARDSYIENYQAMTKESAPGLYSKDLPFSILGSSRGTGAPCFVYDQKRPLGKANSAHPCPNTRLFRCGAPNKGLKRLKGL